MNGPSPTGEHRFDSLEGTASEWEDAPSNLILSALDLGCERLSIDPGPLALSATSEIPLARGLGSSGAAVAAGLRIAATLRGPESTRTGGGSLEEDLVAWAVTLEGHPDNCTPSLLGGCTLSVPLADGRVRVVRQPLSPDLAFCVAWPSQTLTTSACRAVLPEAVGFADAVENPRRLALLLEGLRRGDPELLALGSEDRLHVPYRLPLIGGGAEALAAAREAGAHLATVSGSGSALFAIASHATVAAVAAAMRAVLDRHGPPATARVVEAVEHPAAAQERA